MAYRHPRSQSLPREELKAGIEITALSAKDMANACAFVVERAPYIKEVGTLAEYYMRVRDVTFSQEASVREVRLQDWIFMRGHAVARNNYTLTPTAILVG